MSLIDADKLVELIDDDIASLDMPREGYDVCLCTLRMVKQYIKALPTVEAEPVKHGHWIDEGLVDGNQNRYCRCSECGKGDTQAISQRVPYCWWCGARMDAQICEDKSHPFAESVMMRMDEVENGSCD